MSEFLTTREFENWSRNQDSKLDRILNHVESQTEINLDNAAAIATLRAKQEEYTGQLSKRTTWISSVVSAIVGGVAGALFGRA